MEGLGDLGICMSLREVAQYFCFPSCEVVFLRRVSVVMLDLVAEEAARGL